MTDEMMSLRSLLEKSADVDLLREMVGFAAQRLMELEVESLTGAAHGERSPERINHRNLSRSRLGDPRGHRRATSPQAPKGELLPGVSRTTPDGREGAGCGDPKGLCPGGVHPFGRGTGQGYGHDRDFQEPVSRLCSEIDDKISFLDRPLEGDWPYLWLDATYVKVRQNGRIVSVAVIVAVAVNSDGRREVLGMAVGTSEAETFWTAFLRTLARRGLRGVKLVISDAHEGLKAAVAKVLYASWQRCRVHFMRNVLAHAGKQGRRVVARLHRHCICSGGCRNRS